MLPLSTFALEIQRGEDHEPSRVSVVLSIAAPDADGVLRLTPQCMTLDELEGAINTLQDELDARALGSSRSRRLPATTSRAQWGCISACQAGADERCRTGRRLGERAAQEPRGAPGDWHLN
jgi:hypothetical protein